MNHNLKKLLINLLVVTLIATGLTGTSFAGSSASLAEVFQPITLQQYLGVEYKQLNSEQIKELKTLLDEINNFEMTDDEEALAEFDELNERLENKIREYGLTSPYKTLSDFIETHENKFSATDYERLLTLSSEIEADSEQDDVREAIDQILIKYHMDPEEVFTQIESKNAHLALFDVVKGNIKLSDKSLKAQSEITAENMKLYNKLWTYTKKIIPNAYISKLTKFEINTDGYENVMAHVNAEEEDNSKWRLALDIRDAVNYDGTYNKELNNTIIHEFMHVITLNNSQMLATKNPNSKTYTVDEGTLKEKAYLNQFYNKFWKPLAKDFSKLNNPDLSEEELATLQENFYKKYKSQFVSDYAATNPVEDIAEVYRVFIMEAKPKGNAIKDKKVQFLYNFSELVKFRTEIRKNLGLK